MRYSYKIVCSGVPMQLEAIYYEGLPDVGVPKSPLKLPTGRAHLHVGRHQQAQDLQTQVSIPAS